MSGISAYIPCFNNASTLAATIESIRKQTYPVGDIVVIDDGSTDDSAALAEKLGVRLVRLGMNKGRGAARKRGMEECNTEFVLSVDGNKALPPDFVAVALNWFDDDNVAAVCGRLGLPKVQTLVERWCARHIYRTDQKCEVIHNSLLITAGAVCRRNAFMRAGNFDESLKLAEDREISHRLLELNADIIFDPQLKVIVLGEQDLPTALERFWRWNVGEDALSARDYLKHVSYSIKVMAAKDMEQGDVASAALSLFSAHHAFWRSRGHR